LEAWGREIGPFELHRRLAVLDPEASLEIQPQNVRRTIRALEVIFLTGRRFSQQRQQRGSPYSRLVIGLKRPRAELFRRIDDRIEQMIAGGLVEEVRRLLDAGYPTQLPTLSAIGYQEIAAYLSGTITLEEATIQMKRLTHQFVRRQANWFKENDPNIHWLEAGDDNLSRGLALLADPKAWIPPDQNQAQDLR
jgi:tRNA dimethylallyltransferase